MEIVDYLNVKGDNRKALEAIDEKAAEAGIGISLEMVLGQVNGEVEPADIKPLCRMLKDDRELGFEYIRSITGSDFEDRYEIVYSLYSFARDWSVNIKVRLDHEKPEIDSITNIYRAADWFEREIWEMLGIDIKGHPHLRPLLLVGDEGFYPLRKSFEIKWEKRKYKPPERFK